MSDLVQDVRIYPHQCSILDVLDTMFMLSYHSLLKVWMNSFLLLRGYPSRWFRIHCNFQYTMFAYTRSSVRF